MAEDDFRRWEREFGPGAPEREPSAGRGLAVTVGIIASGCAAVIALGDVPLGAAGLALASIILVLWRIGM